MVIGYHSKSYQKALLTLFPNIGLDINKFIFVPSMFIYIFIYIILFFKLYFIFYILSYFFV